MSKKKDKKLDPLAPVYVDYNPDEHPWHLYLIAFMLFLVLACQIVNA